MKSFWRQQLYFNMFGSIGKSSSRFDYTLLAVIILSVISVMLESIQPLSIKFKNEFSIAEWGFTILFTIEYILRIIIHPKPIRYIASFWGIIDLVAILPSYIGLFVGEPQYLMSIRALRLTRTFKVFHLKKFLDAAKSLGDALKSSSYKIAVFFGSILCIIIVLGTLMYIIEGGQNGFDSIPESIYWAIVTITTVGYGDVVPITVFGKIISSIMMLTGYAIIAVPTGIVTIEMSNANNGKPVKSCPECNHSGIDHADKYCSNCGTKM